MVYQCHGNTPFYRSTEVVPELSYVLVYLYPSEVCCAGVLRDVGAICYYCGLLSEEVGCGCSGSSAVAPPGPGWPSCLAFPIAIPIAHRRRVSEPGDIFSPMDLHVEYITIINVETQKTQPSYRATWRREVIAPQPSHVSIERRLATSKVDVWKRPSRQWCHLICKSELNRQSKEATW